MVEYVPTPWYAMPDDSHALRPNGTAAHVGAWLAPGVRLIDGAPAHIEAPATVVRVVYSEADRPVLQGQALANVFSAFPTTEIISEATP